MTTLKTKNAKNINPELSNLDKIAEVKANTRKNAEVIREARVRNQTNNRIVQELTQETIAKLRDAFLRNCLPNSMDEYNYIHGGYSDQFTKFVDRRGSAISRKHKDAIDKYTEALQNLNRVFLQELRENPNALFQPRDIFSTVPGFKNLHRVKKS